MKLTEINRVYKSGSYTVHIDNWLDKGWSSVYVNDAENDRVCSFDSKEQAVEVARAILQATHEDTEEDRESITS